MPRKGNLIKHIMVLKSVLPSVRDPFKGEGRDRGAVVGGRSQWFFLQGTALWPCHSSPPVDMASHHLCGRTALVGGRVVPLLSSSPGTTAPRHSLLTPVAALSFQETAKSPTVTGSRLLCLKTLGQKCSGHNLCCCAKFQGQKIIVSNLIHLIWLHFLYLLK